MPWRDGSAPEHGSAASDHLESPAMKWGGGGAYYRR
jgi:hypothetical protein